MENFALVCIGAVVIAILSETSNMSIAEKVFTALMMIVLTVTGGIVFTPDLFWVAGCIVGGLLVGGRLNKWLVMRRVAAV